MATTIEQQVALDEALVPSTKRLRIRRSNFRLPSDIQSKESTLQVVYDVLRECPFFKAFLVTTDDMLHISPRVPGQSFDELPFKEEILDFLRFLGHSAQIKTLIDVNVNKLFQPWLSQAQILWGLYRKRNIDYAFLIWEDFVYQMEHKNQMKSNEMYYPIFTKVIIHHFMTKKPSIPRRNKVNWHYVRDDILFSTIKVVSRHQNTQQYGALLPIELTNDEIKNSKAYKEYYGCATGEAAPKPKASARRKRGGFDSSTTPPTVVASLRPTTGSVTPRLTTTAKEQDRHDDEGDEKDDSDDEEGDDDDAKNDDEDDDDKEEIAKMDEPDDTESGGDDEEDKNDEEKEEIDELYRDIDINQGRGLQVSQDIEDSHVTLTPVKPNGQQESSSVSSFVTSMLNPISDAGVESIFAIDSSSIAPLPIPTPTMTPSTITTITTATQAPIPLTPIPSELLQNLPTFDSVFCFNERLKLLEASFSEYRENDEFLKTIDDNMKRIIKEQVKSQVKDQVLRILPRIEQSVNAQLESKVLTRSSHSSRTSYAVAADLSEMELKKILIEKMEGNKSIQHSDEQRNLYKALVEAYEGHKIILDTYGERVILKRRRDDDDDDQGEGPFAGSDRGSKRQRKGKEFESARAPLEPATRSAGRSTIGSKSRQVSASESAFAEEPVQTTSQIEESTHLVFETGAEDQPIVQTSQHPEWFSLPKKPPTPDRDWNKTLPAVQGSAQTWISELVKQANSHSSFNELLDTLIGFSNFIMNQLGVDTLTPELLAGPTYELMKGSCKSQTELEYHMEEVYKSTTDQLDWINPEGQLYPHNLLHPLPLIPDNRGRRVIPFAHFINNDLEYLWGDLVPCSMWIHEPINYDKHALWGVSHWGRKRQQFYGFAVNRESALDVYSKRRIIAVTDLKIVEWHNYKHLDWISVHRDDDKIYKFKEADFKRLRLRDIEDMLLLLVQGKLSNLTVKECFAFNVSLRMFTRSIVIQRRVKDLQLGVESYQKRLNLTKPDTYRSDLKQREVYTAYSNPRGFIYQNKDKKNRLMRINNLYKFSNGTLNDVRNALDDRLKGIRMQYLPQIIWRKGDKDKAAAMIQAIDKMLKTRRIMRSLERFVGGRLYEGDFRILQRTI
nr:hypothetical protein [Tanacetum cinerariifolium]